MVTLTELQEKSRIVGLQGGISKKYFQFLQDARHDFFNIQFIESIGMSFKIITPLELSLNTFIFLNRLNLFKVVKNILSDIVLFFIKAYFIDFLRFFILFFRASIGQGLSGDGS